MKFIFILSLLTVSSNLIAQSDCAECEKFKIVGVYDLGPPPGGNLIVLLLTLTEDLDSGFDPHYSSLYFLTNEGDTVTIPLGASHTLPEFTTDTIPYIMQLATELSNQNFPKDFVGKLVIRTPTSGSCPNVTWCHINYSNIISNITDETGDDSVLNIFPNPFTDSFRIQTEELIENVRIYNQQGQVIYSNNEFSNGDVIHLEKMQSIFLIVVVRYKNGEVAVSQLTMS